MMELDELIEYVVVRIASDGHLVLKWQGSVPNGTPEDEERAALDEAVKDTSIEHAGVFIVANATDSLAILGNYSSGHVYTIGEPEPQPKFSYTLGVPNNPTALYEGSQPLAAKAGFEVWVRNLDGRGNDGRSKNAGLRGVTFATAAEAEVAIEAFGSVKTRTRGDYEVRSVTPPV